MVARAVRGFSDPGRAANAVAGTSGMLGVGTGGFGLYNKAVDSEDDGIKDGAVAGIDGSRLALDGGGLVDIARYVFCH
ncbi:Putative T7SS secretion signal domain-containing protein OS=Streptomyces tendae OX=1932 GN=GUR47_15620 PE=4 SV=1 [Streptomyces tendae]